MMPELLLVPRNRVGPEASIADIVGESKMEGISLEVFMHTMSVDVLGELRRAINNLPCLFLTVVGKGDGIRGQW